MPILSHGESEGEQGILRGIRLAAELTVVILGLEAVGALFSHSLALTVDAVHDIPDLLAFGVSWAALAGTRTGSSSEFTFGTHRLEVFAGIFNGLLVLGTGAAFGYAALAALFRSVAFAGAVDPIWLLAVAVPTLLLRVANIRVLGRAPGPVRDLNLRSVVVHLASDVAITAVLLTAGIVLVVVPALAWADSAGALAIAGILVYESVPLLRGGWDVLTERTPRGLSVDAISRAATAVPGVREIHDVHVWAVCSTLVCLTAHVQIREMSLKESVGVVQRLREAMENEFGIVHATFEVEIA